LRDNMEYDPDLLMQIESRLDVLYRLKKKYGDSVEEILEYKDKIEKELDEILNNEEIVNKLNEELWKKTEAVPTGKGNEQ